MFQFSLVNPRFRLAEKIPTLLGTLTAVCFSLNLTFFSTNQSIAQTNNGFNQPSKLEGFIDSRRIMGVEFTISLYAPNKEIAEKAFLQGFHEIRRMDRIFSNYKKNSESKRLIKKPKKEWQKTSKPMAELLRTSFAIHQKTDGYFDVTLGYLTRTWRTARKNQKLPDDQTLKSALKNCGMEQIKISKTEDKFLHQNHLLELDFGAIAKGYAADRVLKRLKTLGITRVLVDASGDLTAGDPPPNKPGWRIAIAKTTPSQGNSSEFFLSNLSIATSGDAFQYMNTDGGRLSHLLNPKTGEPLVGRRRCTVIAKTGTMADALATAFSVSPTQNLDEIHRRFPGTAYQRTLILDEKIFNSESNNWKRLVKANKPPENQNKK